MVTEGVLHGHRPGVGDVVDGRYRLVRDLGRGAAGAVYEARHLFTGRAVALKLLLPQEQRDEHDEMSARLQREAQLLAAIRHPGVVDVLDGGFTDSGVPFIVLEMLEGRTLQGSLPGAGPSSSCAVPPVKRSSSSSTSASRGWKTPTSPDPPRTSALLAPRASISKDVERTGERRWPGQ